VPKSSWSIGPTEKFLHLENRLFAMGHVRLMLGISTLHGIIPISGDLPLDRVVPLPLKEAEYLVLWDYRPSTFAEFQFTHEYIELMVHNYVRPPLPPSLPCTLPLFSALRVLVVERVNPSFLAGHTFHKLEKCRVVKSPDSFLPSPSLFTETEMPVCTRVDIDDPYLLATFKLPQIREVALDFSHPECSMIWEKHIAVNANLSGLNLLYMKKWPLNGDLIPILRSLASLETLIFSSRLGVVPFKAFLPIGVYGTSGLKQTSGEGQKSRLLCPRLQCLRVEGQNPLVKPKLIRILRDIVTLRAECGSPLKHFTFWPQPGRQLELIGRNGDITMENVVQLEEAEEFKMDISLSLE